MGGGGIVCSPRRLPIPGANLDNVYCLRVAEEAHAIAAKAEGKNLVVIGSSFIGTPDSIGPRARRPDPLSMANRPRDCGV